MKLPANVYLLGLLALVTILVCSAAANQITVNPSQFEYVFKSATASPAIWTTVATRRVINTSVKPTTVGSDDVLRISSAAQELESFQIVVEKTSVSSMTVTYPSTFSGSSLSLSCGPAPLSPPPHRGQGAPP